MRHDAERARRAIQASVRMLGQGGGRERATFAQCCTRLRCLHDVTSALRSATRAILTPDLCRALIECCDHIAQTSEPQVARLLATATAQLPVLPDPQVTAQPLSSHHLAALYVSAWRIARPPDLPAVRPGQAIARIHARSGRAMRGRHGEHVHNPSAQRSTRHYASTSTQWIRRSRPLMSWM